MALSVRPSTLDATSQKILLPIYFWTQGILEHIVNSIENSMSVH